MPRDERFSPLVVAVKENLNTRSDLGTFTAKQAMPQGPTQYCVQSWQGMTHDNTGY